MKDYKYENGILSKEIYVRSLDVNRHKILKTSRLFDYFQDIAFDHVNLLGCGTDRTIDRGILWVLASQQVRISRMPRYEETVVLKTWPAGFRMGFFTRNYAIETADGELLVESASIWGLINASTRELVKPEEYGIVVEPVTVEGAMKSKGGPKPIDFTSSSDFVIPFSYIDVNGHLNNARYLDIIDDTIPAASQGLEPHSINARYATETLEGETISVDWGCEDNSYYVSIDSSDINHFKLRIDY